MKLKNDDEALEDVRQDNKVPHQIENAKYTKKPDRQGKGSQMEKQPSPVRALPLAVPAQVLVMA